MKKLTVFILTLFSAIISSSQDVIKKPERQFGLGTLESVAYHPDGKHILTAGSGGAFLWNIATEDIVHKFKTDYVYSIVISPDGKFLVTGGNEHSPSFVNLWDLETGTRIHTFTTNARYVAISPDGSKILTADTSNGIVLWDAITYEEILNYGYEEKKITCITFSPGSTQFAVGYKYSSNSYYVSVHDIKTKKLVNNLSQTAPVVGVAFSLDGSQLLTGQRVGFGPTGNSGSGAELWDLSTDKKLASFQVPYSIAGVQSVMFSRDGTKILTGGVVWDVTTKQILFQKDGTDCASFSFDSKKILWGHRSSSWGLIWSNWNDLGYVTLTDITSGVDNSVFKGHSMPVKRAEFLLEGSYIVTNEEREMYFPNSYGFIGNIWDINTDEYFFVFGKDSWPDTSPMITISPDKTKKLEIVNRCVYLMDMETGRLLRSFCGHNDDVNSATFSPDGEKVLTGSEDGTARLWDISDITASTGIREFIIY